MPRSAAAIDIVPPRSDNVTPISLGRNEIPNRPVSWRSANELRISGLQDVFRFLPTMDYEDDEEFVGVMLIARARLESPTDADFAASMGISISTAQRWFQASKLPYRAARRGHVAELANVIQARITAEVTTFELKDASSSSG